MAHLLDPKVVDAVGFIYGWSTRKESSVCCLCVLTSCNCLHLIAHPDRTKQQKQFSTQRISSELHNKTAQEFQFTHPVAFFHRALPLAIIFHGIRCLIDIYRQINNRKQEQNTASCTMTYYTDSLPSKWKYFYRSTKSTA